MHVVTGKMVLTLTVDMLIHMLLIALRIVVFMVVGKMTRVQEQGNVEVNLDIIKILFNQMNQVVRP